MIMQVSGVLRNTTIADNDWCFNNLCGSHLLVPVNWNLNLYRIQLVKKGKKTMKLTFFIFLFPRHYVVFFLSVVMECGQQVSPQCFCWQDCKNLGHRSQHCLYVSSFPCNQMIRMSVVSFLYHLQNGSSPTPLLPLQLVQIWPSPF